MSPPSTKILDHIVHLTPPGTVDEVTRQFKDLGFNVIPGGTHAGGFTANALVILDDGVYLELISFTHPPSHYPPSSPDRQRRDANPWASKPPGWIDLAFLGSSTASISHLINERAEKDGSGVRYAPEVEGGRTRGDGKLLKWVISAGDDSEGVHKGSRGSVPFFCGDVTPRSWRVPVDPPSNSVHPSGVKGIAHVRILARQETLVSLSAQLTSIIGDAPQLDISSSSRSAYTWTLETPTSSSSLGARLILSGPGNEEEENHIFTKGSGIFEVAFSVGPGGNERESNTPYGKIVWLRS